MAFNNSIDSAAWLDELKVARKNHIENTVITLPLPDGSSEITIGDNDFTLMAGPCSIESSEQLMATGRAVQKSGAVFLRGGAFKCRTSPYDFHGMREEGLELLLDARRELNIPVITEIINIAHLPLFEDVDIIQVGERNMRNGELLTELGRCGKPVLLKRSRASTLQEFLLSAEYLAAAGCGDIILCERGIRTFETLTRNTLDISAIPLLKTMTHLPVLVDPSHAGGISDLVKPLSLASAAAGADGLIIEVHNQPECALCDGPQSITPEEFDDIANSLQRLLPHIG